MVRKGDKWRPYDGGEAVARAARCRMQRERVGLNRRALATLAGVTERSAGRWEDEDGAGNCPPDVLALLDALAARQRGIVEAYSWRGEAVASASFLDHGSRTAAAQAGACIGPDGGGEVNPAVYTDSVHGPYKLDLDGSPEVDFDARGAGPDDADDADGDLDAMGALRATILCYPSQRCYELCHPNSTLYYGVVNANAQAVAQELEAIGFEIDWKYATVDEVSRFE